METGVFQTREEFDGWRARAMRIQSVLSWSSVAVGMMASTSVWASTVIVTLWLSTLYCLLRAAKLRYDQHVHLTILEVHEALDSGLKA